MLAELVRSGGQDSRESFEVRLNEIDMELGRFDKVRGGLSEDNLEREKVGFKEQKLAKETDEPFPKSVDRHDDNPDRLAENVDAKKCLSQTRVLEPCVKEFSQSRLYEDNLETAGLNDESNGPIHIHSEVLVPSAIKRPISNSNGKDLKQAEPGLAQPLIFSNGPSMVTKPL